MMQFRNILFSLAAASSILPTSAESSEKSGNPIINPDNSVSFKISLPGYDDDLYLKGSFLDSNNFFNAIRGKSGKGKGKIEMEKADGDDGIYTYRSLPLESDIYTYNFIDEDDRAILDPDNPNVMRDIDNYLNYFIIPGGTGDLFIATDVPHGTLNHVWYPSIMPGKEKRRMSIYLPPQYYSESERRFPVLYLLHGSGGDEDSWSELGLACRVLDNMIAQGRCKPMIVVMPNGNVDLAAAPGSDPDNPDIKPSGNNVSSMFGTIESVFMTDIVGYLDNHYRTIPGPDSRAIAGLSLGGLHTLFTVLNNPGEFDYIGLFSAQTTNALDNNRIAEVADMRDAWIKLKNRFAALKGGKVNKAISAIGSPHLEIYEDFDKKLDTEFANPPALLYIAYGKDDFVRKLNEDLRLTLDNKGYPYVFNLSEGGHTWDNWRHYLIDFLPRLF